MACVARLIIQTLSESNTNPGSPLWPI
uniref:Uncharacterized protein n=1 Tax=Anguilla anguilla TaxID=7936 RepID=A0A0E9Q3G9_ANGAN